MTGRHNACVLSCLLPQGYQQTPVPAHTPDTPAGVIPLGHQRHQPEPQAPPRPASTVVFPQQCSVGSSPTRAAAILGRGDCWQDLSGTRRLAGPCCRPPSLALSLQGHHLSACQQSGGQWNLGVWFPPSALLTRGWASPPSSSVPRGGVSKACGAGLWGWRSRTLGPGTKLSSPGSHPLGRCPQYVPWVGRAVTSVFPRTPRAGVCADTEGGTRRNRPEVFYSGVPALPGAGLHLRTPSSPGRGQGSVPTVGSAQARRHPRLVCTAGRGGPGSSEEHLGLLPD